jgi:Fe-S-cluster-containing dehydrogenase component
MARYGFVFNVERCNGCFSCFLACKDEHTGNCHCPTCAATTECINLKRIDEVQYGSDDKVKVDYMHYVCQQCADPACMKKFPNEIYKRDDGIVIIDPEKAKGKKEIVDACPYNAIVWNPEAQLPQKCTMCAHMLDAGETVTRCSEVCPNAALLFGDLDDPNSEISKYVAEHKDELEKLHPEFGTGPAHWYRHIPKPFICGEVVCKDTDECCKGAKVTLTCDECGTARTTETDFLGDFEFRGLPTNQPFTVKIEADGYKPCELKARTKASVNLGEIFIEKA